MSNSEITPHEDSEGTPIRLESISSTPQRRQDGVRSEAAYEEGTLSELTSAVTSTYTSVSCHQHLCDVASLNCVSSLLIF